MALGFVDLEKAFDTVPRDMVMATGQRAEPPAVHSSTGPHQQEDGGEGCHEDTPLCRRPGPGGEWQTGATGDTGGVERAVYQTRAEN